MNWFNLQLPSETIEINRNGFIFQLSKNNLCGLKFKKKRKPQVVGYRYYLGMHMVAGHGHMDGCERIRVGEKTAWTTSDSLKDSHTSAVTAYILSSIDHHAQTFTTTSSYIISSVSLFMWRNWNAYPGTLIVSIRDVDTNTGLPTGDDLTKGTTDGDTLLEQPVSIDVAEWRNIKFDFPIELESGKQYAIVVRCLPFESEGFGGANWNADNMGSRYTGGKMCYSLDEGITWQFESDDDDFIFKTYKQNGDSPNSTIYVSNDSLFGGDKKEGGVSGSVDFMFGASDQAQNSYLVSRLDSDIPAFRGLFSAVLRQVYVGTSPYLKPWSFLCKRVGKQIDGSTQWYPEKAVINARTSSGDDLNAVHIIRECLVAPEWGLGWSSDDIDDDSFKEAANILYDEDFGLSMLWDQVQPIEDFIDEILNYIAGIIYQDLSTGKWVLTLTRDPDYSTAYNSYTTSDDNQANASIGNARLCQTFTTERIYTPASIDIKVYKQLEEHTCNIRCEIQGVDEIGDPDGIILAYGNIVNSELTTSASWLTCTLNSTSELSINTKYALVIYPIDGAGTIFWRYDSYGQYEYGHYISSGDGGSTWSKQRSKDFMFKIYAGGQLETFNEDDIIEVEEFTRPAYGEITDVVSVKFWDKLNHKTRSTEARDIALIEKQGGAVIEKILNYQGICNVALANRVAERELKLMTSMLAGVRLKCTRRMAHLKPNDVFKFSWDELDISQMALRVLNANYGSLHKNEVILTCVEDEFGAAPTIYGDAADTLSTEEANEPVNVSNVILEELPYFSLVNDIFGSEDLVASLDDDAGYLAVVASKPVDDSYDYDLYARLSASYNFEDIGEGNNRWTPSAIITNGLTQNAEDVDVDLTTEIDLDFVEDNTFAIINDEIVLINSVDYDNMQINISRGVLDTTPQAHSANDRIYFMDLNYSMPVDEYTNSNQPQVKILTRTSLGTLDIDDADIQTSDAFNSRMIRPYPPGNLKFNGESFPSYFSTALTGKLAITWNHRDRTDVVQLNSIVKHTTSSNYGPEASTTYTIKIYGVGDVLGRTVTGLSGTSYDYTEAFELSDFGSLQDTLRFVIYAVRDGYNSWNDGYNVTLERSYRGDVASDSNLTGELIAYFDGRNRINPATSLNGEIIKTIELYGSASSSSNLTGVMNPESMTESYSDGCNAYHTAYWVGATEQWIAQTFTASESYDLIRTILNLYRLVDDPGNIEVSIKATDGGGSPTGVDLCSAILNAGGFTTDSNGREESFSFDSPYSLTNGIKYAIILKAPTNETTYVRWKVDDTSPSYSGGNFYYSLNGGSTWNADSSLDGYFKNFKSSV